MFNLTLGPRTKVVFGVLILLFAAFVYLTSPDKKTAEKPARANEIPFDENFDEEDYSLVRAFLKYEAEKTEREILQTNPPPEEANRLRIAAQSIESEKIAQSKVLELKRQCHDWKTSASECRKMKTRKQIEINIYIISPRPTPKIDPVPSVKAPPR
jgi:hypothetical protein